MVSFKFVYLELLWFRVVIWKEKSGFRCVWLRLKEFCEARLFVGGGRIGSLSRNHIFFVYPPRNPKLHMKRNTIQ